MDLRIWVIIPAHNERVNIGSIVNTLKAFHEVKRILVVDDMSEDDTEMTAGLAGAEVLRLGPGSGGGKGLALRAGIDYLMEGDFDFYLFLDGDGQHDPRDLSRFLECYYNNTNVDFVIGSRKKQSNLIPKKRWFTNSLGSWTLGRIAGVKWEDTQSGFRMIRKRVIDRMNLGSRGFAIEMEIALKAAHHKITWAHVPINVIYHPGCPSHFRGFWDVIKIMFYSLLC